MHRDDNAGDIAPENHDELLFLYKVAPVGFIQNVGGMSRRDLRFFVAELWKCPASKFAVEDQFGARNKLVT